MHKRLHFDIYEVDPSAGQLRRQGVKISLREKPLRVLLSLLECPGEVVTREELRRRLWPDDVFVDFDNNLNAAVARLREALGDSAERPRFVETLHKHGYRFLAKVSETITAAPPKVRLVVLPFLNLSGDPGQEYISDAVTEEIITQIATLAPESLGVIARTTAMHYKSSHLDVAQIAHELRIDYVVEGSVRREGDNFSITVQLVRADDQTHLFANRYEVASKHLFEMRTRIAAAIAANIDSAAVAREAQSRFPWVQSRRNPTEHLAAFNEYIQGRYLLGRLTPEAVARAKKHFEDAIESDPEFALAHCALAELYSTLGYVGYMRPKDAYAKGFPSALRAVEIDDTLAEGHALLATYHKQRDYDWQAAEKEFQKALDLDPASPSVRSQHAVGLLLPQNRIREAIREIERALELDPLSAVVRTWVGLMLLMGREYDRAIDESRRFLELEPTSCWPYYTIGIAYRQKYYDRYVAGGQSTIKVQGKPDFAEEAIRGHLKAIELAPGINFFLGWLGLALGICGRKQEAREVLKKLRQPDQYVLPSSFAHVHFGLGEIDAAFEWFDRAIEERDQMMMPILSYAHFDPLRQDPRFAKLLSKMNLATSKTRTA
jgi:TolB-like protein/Tfp pilus assembly protein PilF